MNNINIIKLDKPQIIRTSFKNPQAPKFRECIDPFLTLSKHYLFEGNFEKAEELVNFFLPFLKEEVIIEIQDVILRLFITKNVSEYRKINYGISEEEEDMLFDFLNCATDDNAFRSGKKFDLPNLPRLLPKNFTKAHPNAPEIALNFLKQVNLFNYGKTRNSGFKFMLDDFVRGLEMNENEDGNNFFDGLVVIVSKISKAYRNKGFKLYFREENITNFFLSRDSVTKFLTAIFNSESSEEGILTTTLDDKEFSNELQRITGLLNAGDFGDFSLDDKLSTIDILLNVVVEMGLFTETCERIKLDSRISHRSLKDKLREKQKIEEQFNKLSSEIALFEDGGIDPSGGKMTRHMASEKRKELRELKIRLEELNEDYQEMESKKNAADYIQWNRFPHTLGRDRDFNIYKLSTGFDFIYVMKPKNAKYSFSGEKYAKTYKPNCTVNDELISKLSPIMEMECDGYEYFYVNSVEKLEKFISLFDDRGVREKELLKNLEKVKNIAKLHIETHQRK
uniref:WSD domain-containing protein n=1 Tax=Strongyloides venezuelensis TaxID=75913 RepID=A0A0K0EZK1_STRVS